MERKLTLAKSSRYKLTPLLQTKQEDTGDDITYFGTFQYPSLKSGDVITLTSKYVGRLDILAQEVYGNPDLWWVIAQANNISDPIYGVEAGMVIVLPDIETMTKAEVEGLF